MRGLLVLLAVVLAASCSGEPDAGTSTASTGTPTTPATTTATTATTTTATTATNPSSTPGSTATTTGVAPPVDVVVPEGYERVQATVTEPDGTVCELCLWMADTNEARRQGLMFVTDLGAADGMAFVYPEPHTGTFWMKNTLLPLSIAFFAPDGRYLDAFDMEPCTDDPCRQYPTAEGFLVAIETSRGDLPALGIGPGSVLDLSDLPCDD